MSTHKLRIGLIGAGRIGKIHAKTIASCVPSATACAICDFNISAAQEVANTYDIPRVTISSQELLDDPSIEAIVISSPTETHAEMIIGAARAGKHIFCEKPIALSLSRIDLALDAVEAAGVKLQVGFNRRFDANFRRIREAVAGGEIGTPHLLHIISRDAEPPTIGYVRSSGGIFFDMTIHDFDMARFLIGDEVDEIYATGAVRINPEIGAAGDLDTAMTVLRFRGGVIGTIDNSRKAVYGYDQRAEVFGSAGAIATGNAYPNEGIISTAREIRRDLPLNFFLTRYATSYIDEISSFVDAVLNNRPVAVNGLDGRVPVAMATAAYLSFRENRPVKLAEVV